MTTPNIIERRLSAVKNQPVDHAALARQAIELAADLLRESRLHLTAKDRAQAAKLARMMNDPAGKAFTLSLADQLYRARRPARAADIFAHLVRKHGIPRYLAPAQRLLMRAGVLCARIVPSLVMPAVAATLRAEASQVILSSDPARLRAHRDKRLSAGIRLNLNLLGEAILGETEARRRLDAILDLLACPETGYISVKISSICSQINILAFEDTLAQIQQRLRILYRAAQRNTRILPDGAAHPKFINLDMEEYRDLHLTLEAFKRTLSEPEFHRLPAGIVLQAYLPDSHAAQRDLTDWALARVAAGGAPIKLRIVKGANLAMERIDASIHGWPQAPYLSKAGADANYKRLLHYACDPARAAAVRIGVASHNLFDLAYALLLRSALNIENHLDIEMLEGMANHQAAVIQRAAGNLLLYAPIVSKNDFPNAIAYLIRRLDENTAPENFLHDLFSLTPGSAAWDAQAARFREAIHCAATVPGAPARTQNRATENHQRAPLSVVLSAPPLITPPFANASDTDWTLPANRDWVTRHIKTLADAPPAHIPLQIAGEHISPGPAQRHATAASATDPSRPGATAFTVTLAAAPLIERAIAAARAALPGWSVRAPAERRELLLRAAAAFAARRGELIASAILDAGKAPHESDPEVSEAIDFASYYARAYDDPAFADGATPAPLGVVTVAPPWNFPIAIPVGGILAALMAGNTVIFKPAGSAIHTGYRLAECLWEAGIPKNALQFVTPVRDAAIQLITDPRVAAVILTGATETAEKFLGHRPGLRLFAETGGKNSMIVTAAADHDQAIRDTIKSAFGHNGQKCSAASLLILEAEVYDNPGFLRQLRDAAESLRAGSAWSPASLITPLIHAPDDTLRRALTTLDEGETWLLEPRNLDNNPALWTPGIKLGVRPGSWYHHTECFGPVLGVMRADNLDHAIALANAVKYGLTAGLHTLDEREIARWRDRIEAGNLYINRHTTGAIVRRQPFGGWKASSYGPGAKAGGPNYVAQFSTWTQTALPSSQSTPAPDTAKILSQLKTWLAAGAGESGQAMLVAAAGSYTHACETEFSRSHDPSRVHGEHNHLRYLPHPGILIRAASDTPRIDIALALMAACVAGVRATLSAPEPTGLPHVPGVTHTVESDDDLAARLAGGDNDKTLFRQLCPASEHLLRTINKHRLTVLAGAPLASGRLELRPLYREQSISHSYHRHGNIIDLAP